MTETNKNSIWVQQDLAPGLYLIATPIGNLRDISFRALDMLVSADLILCEDTRVTGKLLTHFGIGTKKSVYNDHSNESRRLQILNDIEQNNMAIALVSDAGMPMISDPGYKLVKEAMDRDIRVTSIPGANAPLMAMQLSGLPSDRFAFIGFMPHKSGGRKSVLETYKAFEGSLIVFEGPSRLAASLRDMASVLGQRDVAVTRELTKYYEEIKRGGFEELAIFYETQGAPKGEIVVVIGPPTEQDLSEEDVDKMLVAALEKMRIKEAAGFVAEQTGMPKKALYQRALELKD